MAITVTTTLPLPAADYCPPGNTLRNAVSWVAQYLGVTAVPDAASGVVVLRQSNTPTPAPNVIWQRIESALPNAPLGQYVFMNGRWVPDPMGRRIGDYLITDFNPNGYMDANGKGLFIPVSPAADTANIAGPLFGWHLADNLDGAPNVKNRFMLAGYKYVDGTGWVASVLGDDGTYSDQTNGGREGITLMDNATTNHLPSLQTAEYDPAGNASTARVYAGTKYTVTTPALVNPGIKAQDAIRPVNPLYKVVGVFQWIGYSAASA